jgi:SagB-type dehydrogenase family enzyme
MRRFRQDLDWLTSALLLVAAGAAIVTGIASDVWDIRTFIPHVSVGYVMTILAITHVALNWDRLVGYGRFRVRRLVDALRATAMPRPQPDVPRTPAVLPAAPARAGPPSRRLSRRGFVGLLVGGAGGLLVGRALRTGPELVAGTDVGVAYHRWSGAGIGDLFGTVADWGGQVAPYKTYPGAPHVVLPAPAAAPPESFGDLASRRRSARRYAGRPLALAQLSAVVEQAAAITEQAGSGRLRAAPSCGALYPIETYVAVHHVDGLMPGLYHHAVQMHALELVRPGDLRNEVVTGGLYQEFLGQANAVVILTTVFQRARWKYHERTYRYALIEAGHYGQNLYLAATALGLGAAAVGAFFDADVNRTLGVDGIDEAALYLVAIGTV